MPKDRRKPNNTHPITFVITGHSRQRINERMPSGFEMPPAGSYVRLIKVKDTLYNRETYIVRVKGGAIIGQWTSGKYKLLIVTVFDEKTLNRLQKRKSSRFLPLESECFEVIGTIETLEMVLAANV
jgi:hypothetical protein